MKPITHHHFGPGDDEDKDGSLRPVDKEPDEDAEETAAVQAGAGALVE